MNMTTDTQSNSKFYHGDCLCDKIINTSIIAIQCKYCIDDDKSRFWHNSREYKCFCKDIKIKHRICNICASFRDKIDKLNNELDNLSYNMLDEIKQYFNCETKLERIKQISIELRHLNRKLLQNLVTNKETVYNSSDEENEEKYEDEENEGKYEDEEN